MNLATRSPAVDLGHARPTLVVDHAASRRRELPPGGGQPASQPGRSGHGGWELVARIVQWALFAILAGSVAYIATHLPWAPESSTDPSVRVGTDFILMLLQCGGGLIAMFLPAIIQRRLEIAVPSAMRIGYFLFLFASIYLGEVCSFYYRFPNWDSVLHFISGAMLATVGFFLVRLLAGEPRGSALSPGFVAMLAFCFAAASGAIWEIYEYSVDNLFGTNMQKTTTDTGRILTGRVALADTMSDLILGITAALIASVAGYFSLLPTRTTTQHSHQLFRPARSPRPDPGTRAPRPAFVVGPAASRGHTAPL